MSRTGSVGNCHARLPKEPLSPTAVDAPPPGTNADSTDNARSHSQVLPLSPKATGPGATVTRSHPTPPSPARSSSARPRRPFVTQRAVEAPYAPPQAAPLVARPAAGTATDTPRTPPPATSIAAALQQPAPWKFHHALAQWGGRARVLILSQLRQHCRPRAPLPGTPCVQRHPCAAPELASLPPAPLGRRLHHRGGPLKRTNHSGERRAETCTGPTDSHRGRKTSGRPRRFWPWTCS